MWQLSQDKTTWRYNLLPTTDKTNVSQNGIRRGTHEEASEGVCENVPQGLTLVPPPTAKSMRHYQWHVADRDYEHAPVNAPGRVMTELLLWPGQCCPTSTMGQEADRNQDQDPTGLVRTWGHYTLGTSTRCKTYFDPNKHVHNSSEGRELYRNARETKPLMKG